MQNHLAQKIKCFSINLTKQPQGLHKEILKNNNNNNKKKTVLRESKNLNKCEIFLFMS